MPEEVTVLVTVAVVAALVLGMETEREVERRLLQSSRALSWMSMSWSAWQESVKQLAWACMRSSRPEQMHSTSREPSQPISGRPRARHSVAHSGMSIIWAAARPAPARRVMEYFILKVGIRVCFVVAKERGIIE